MLTICGIDHVVLRVSDIDRMRKFYCEVLGAQHVAYRPEFGMSHLRVGAAMIDLVKDEPRVAATWTTSACASSPSTRKRSSPT